MYLVQLLSLSLFSISVSLSLFFLLQRTGKRTLEDGRARIFLFEQSSGRESEKENDFPKKKEERKKERRKKRYTRGGSWEKRNLRKVIRSHRSKETRVRKVSKSLAIAKHKMHFRTRPFVFYTRKKIWSFEYCCRISGVKNNIYAIVVIVIVLLALTSHNVEHKSRHRKWHWNIDLTKSFFGQG